VLGLRRPDPRKIEHGQSRLGATAQPDGRDLNSRPLSSMTQDGIQRPTEGFGLRHREAAPGGAVHVDDDAIRVAQDHSEREVIDQITLRDRQDVEQTPRKQRLAQQQKGCSEEHERGIVPEPQIAHDVGEVPH